MRQIKAIRQLLGARKYSPSYRIVSLKSVKRLSSPRWRPPTVPAAHAPVASHAASASSRIAVDGAGWRAETREVSSSDAQ